MTDKPLTLGRPRHAYVPSQLRVCGHVFEDGITCCALPENQIHNISAAMDAAACTDTGPDASGDPERMVSDDRRQWLRDKIANDPDLDTEAGARHPNKQQPAQRHELICTCPPLPEPTSDDCAIHGEQAGDKLKAIIDAQAANITDLESDLREALGDTATMADRNLTLRQQNAALREALKSADAAINPPDRKGISLHVWNERLKAATKIIRAALEASE